MNLVQHIHTTDDANCPFQARVARNTLVSMAVFDAADDLAEKAKIAREAVAAVREAEDRLEAERAKAEIIAALDRL